MIALVLLACRPDGARLEGLWVNEETEIRALSFEPLDTPEPNGTRLAYDLYLYRPSQDPRVVQSGFLGVLPAATDGWDAEVVFDVRDDIEPTNIGARFAADMAFEGRDTLNLDGRLYTRADALPDGPGGGSGALLGHAPARGVLWDLTVDGSDAIWAIGDELADDWISGLGADGQPLDPQPVDTPLPPSLVSHGDLRGFSPQTGGLFAVDRDFAVVWQRSETCRRLVDAGEHWVGACFGLGADVQALAPDVVDQAVVWFEPETGTPVHAIAGLPGPFGLFGLASGSDVLIEAVGSSATPEVHGDRQGQVLRREGLDGQRWSTWTPRGLIASSATDVAGSTLVWTSNDGDLPGAGDADGFPKAHVMIGPDGAFEWRRELLAGAVLGTPTGFVSGFGAGPDIGGPDGSGRTDYPFAFVVGTFDACGDLVATAVHAECDIALGDPDYSASVADVAYTSEGDVAMAVNFAYQQCFEGVRYTGPAIVKVAAPDAAPGCTPEGVLPDPVVQVTITGDGTVFVGDQSCTTSCTLSVPLFAELVVSAEAAAGSAPTGLSGCTGDPCLLHADQATSTVTASFQPLQAEPHPYLDGALASGASVLFAGRTSGATGVIDLGGQTVVEWGADLGGAGANIGFGVRPGADEAVASSQSPWEIHRFDAGGHVESFAPTDPIVQLRDLAMDGAGQVAFVHYDFAATPRYSLRAVSPGSTDWETPLDPALATLGATGLDGGGFAVLAITDGSTWGAFATPVGEALVFVDGAGVPTAVVPVGYLGVNALRLEPDGAGGVWLLYVETAPMARHFDGTGAEVSSLTLQYDFFPALVLRDGAGFALVAEGTPAAGGLGGYDLLAARLDASGAVTASLVAGGPGFDQIPYNELSEQTTVGPDGSIWLKRITPDPAVFRFP
ncbi:MAG: hypothetical protein H6737_12505 [Alphaproteobacteria bacterium]|nr:hypothetical protein [Alphaproteobacteria bacterium]